MYASDLKHPKPDLQQKLTELYSLRSKAIDLSFRPPYMALLEKFGNPHLRLPPVIHVAGTNGKGSTIAILRSILETAGYKVHAYTSPHLKSFNERIYLAGKDIEDEPLEALIDEALALNEGNELTFFEITTAMAFAAFACTPADICLLEVGMGGRLDCTNVIERPLVTIITPVSMDHMEHLGDTIAAIASEKAGIMKKNVPCIIGKQKDQAVDDVFEDKAAQLGVTLHRFGSDWVIEPKMNQLRFWDKSVDIILSPTNLMGAHQIENAGAALAALRVISGHLPVSEAVMARGLQNVQWPARLQRLEKPALPTGWELWLDGGHNESAAQALAAQARDWTAQDGKPLHLIIGMMDHKNPATFLAPLSGLHETLTALEISGEPHSLRAADIPGARPAPSLTAALDHLTNTHPPGRILITGSLYLAGDVLKQI